MEWVAIVVTAHKTLWCLKTGLYRVLLGFSLASEACTETLVPMVDVNSGL